MIWTHLIWMCLKRSCYHYEIHQYLQFSNLECLSCAYCTILKELSESMKFQEEALIGFQKWKHDFMCILNHNPLKLSFSLKLFQYCSKPQRFSTLKSYHSHECFINKNVYQTFIHSFKAHNLKMLHDFHLKIYVCSIEYLLTQTCSILSNVTLKNFNLDWLKLPDWSWNQWCSFDQGCTFLQERTIIHLFLWTMLSICQQMSFQLSCLILLGWD